MTMATAVRWIMTVRFLSPGTRAMLAGLASRCSGPKLGTRRPVKTQGLMGKIQTLAPKVLILITSSAKTELVIILIWAVLSWSLIQHRHQFLALKPGRIVSAVRV